MEWWWEGIHRYREQIGDCQKHKLGWVGGGLNELGEDSQKVQISSYEISSGNVMYSMSDYN